ncbi:DUF4188 domain-containing protein [Methylobacterium sp. NMS14P]|uniref:DUF4188 domain-containing protein n=1 Tax=Methylobacterium sp. NMS14P TaxID=2894310 RepID=UPI00235944B6|nr:DUF4188 domain-containing protein [Methylobacterium sp. NMS14P]WCS23019.1 DUF4188 domain-containing protein [Methylobacterium sp. NMS14P]
MEGAIMGANRRDAVPDFSGYPDLVVIYLGMKVRTLAGVKTLLGFGPRIDRVGAARPEGLLHYENNIIFSLRPLHVGMRWYWRDMDSMVAWSKSEPHRIWWRDFLRDTRGVGIWHETYHMRGGMEAIYHDVAEPVGFSAFMPMQEARGSLAARHGRYASSDLRDLPADNAPDAPVPR